MVLVHHRCHQNGQSFWYIFSSLFCLLLPWQPLGWYGASNCPMGASSGFLSSPGHAASWRCTLYCTGGTPWPLKWPMTDEHVDAIVNFVIHNNRSQRPCYGPLKLKLRHSIIYYNVISLLLCFGHPPTTMDSILATIVASGWANINWT